MDTVQQLGSMSQLQLGKLTEPEARAFLEAIRWPNGPVCPHCKSTNAGRIAANPDKKVRPGLLKCRDCKKQFTVTVGTVFEDSHISLEKWFFALGLMCSSKKGVSALQLQRNLGLGSYRTAWFMAHRIREMMNEGPLAELLAGTLEADETYVGGKPRKGGRNGSGPYNDRRKHGGRPDPATSNKTPVVALVQRDGKVRTRVVARVTSENLKQVIRDNADPNARIMTDEFVSYKGIGKEFEGGHHTVNHGKGEYARGDVHVNSAESFFALLKRGVYGVFHHVSREHLHRYTNEFSFRWNHRKLTDGERVVAALLGSWRTRLIYALAW
jgi:transposase-like protein